MLLAQQGVPSSSCSFSASALESAISLRRPGLSEHRAGFRTQGPGVERARHSRAAADPRPSQARELGTCVHVGLHIFVFASLCVGNHVLLLAPSPEFILVFSCTSLVAPFSTSGKPAPCSSSTGLLLSPLHAARLLARLAATSLGPPHPSSPTRLPRQQAQLLSGNNRGSKEETSKEDPLEE